MVSNQRTTKRLHSLLAIVVVLSCIASAELPAYAIDYFWKSPVSGDPTVATNWTPTGVPSTASDNAIFNLGSSGYTVSAAQAVVFNINALEVDNDTVTFHSPTLQSSIGTVIVGNNAGDVGNLTLTLGQIFATTDGAVGNAAGSTGTVTVNGPNFNTLFGTKSIGYGGNGTVNIITGTAGATYVGNLSGSQGTVTASGLTSAWSTTSDAYLGYGGTGSVTIENGAKGSAPTQYIGYSSGSQGTLSVTGTGSNWTNSNTLNVGYGGTGEMDITAGATAKATAAHVYLGFQAGGNGTMKIDGSGSSFQMSPSNGSLYVGESGTGKLSITSGGKLDTQGQAIVVGDLAGSNGSFSVDGATSSLSSSTTTSGEVDVGNQGTGGFSLTNGAKVTLSSLGVGYGAGGAGTVTIDGAATSLSAPNLGVQLGNSFSNNNGTATVTVQNGATLNAIATLGNQNSSTGNFALTFDGAGTTGNTPLTVYQGAVRIQNGAVVNTGQQERMTIGPNTGNNGSISVDGAGSALNVMQGSHSEIDVGSLGGTALLSVSNGGAVNIGVQGGLGLGSLFVGTNGTVDIGQGKLNTFSVYNGGSMHIDGTLQAITFNSTGFISGTGRINSNLTFSGTLAPGDSPGTLTTGSLSWNAGGILKIAVNDANGTAGGTTGWSMLSVVGVAELESLPHTISLESLTAGNQPGLVPDFDPTHNYSWTILQTNGSVQDVGGFNVDTSGFANPLIGHFTVTATANLLVLNYTVPEPSTLALAGLGTIVIGTLGMRRRAKHEST